MTARQDFTINSGRSYAIGVTVTEADLETRVNLMDCTIDWVAKSGGAVTRIVKSSSDPTEIEITAIDEGELTIYVLKSDTDALGEMVCDHELVITDSLGGEATVLRGLLTIARSQLH